jgi:hypothetical protein
VAQLRERRVAAQPSPATQLCVAWDLATAAEEVASRAAQRRLLRASVQQRRAAETYGSGARLTARGAGASSALALPAHPSHAATAPPARAAGGAAAGPSSSPARSSAAGARARAPPPPRRPAQQQARRRAAAVQIDCPEQSKQQPRALDVLEPYRCMHYARFCALLALLAWPQPTVHTILVAEPSRCKIQPWLHACGRCQKSSPHEGNFFSTAVRPIQGHEGLGTLPCQQGLL